MAAVRTTVQSAAIRGTATVDHLVDIFYFGRTRMKRVYNFFIMITKDFLEYIHKIIMQKKIEKGNPFPSRMRGQGS